MKKLNRRTFLQVASASSAAAAGVGISSVAILTEKTSKTNSGMMTFRAVTGMPAKPLPSYASYVVEGHLDLSSRSGVITKAVFAGTPQAMSTIALPGMSRIGRITDVQQLNNTLLITGVVDDRSQLQRGENPTFTVTLDAANRLVKTDLLGQEVALFLER